MATSFKRNFLYNIILTVGNYIFPLLVYPYVSRVLGVDNIGICNYVDSIINYFVLFSALGVGSLGVREVARAKENKENLDSVFSTLVFFNVLLTVFAVILLVCLALCVPFFESYKDFLLIGILKLVMSAFLIEWFYQGISNFKFVTIRSLIVRTLYVLGVFLFVHTKDDSLIYYFLTCFMVVGNAAYNWFYSRKFVHISFESINLKLYFVPILSYGLYRILTSMYTTFNVTFLGTVTCDTEVGYFTTATKLYTIIMSLFTAFTTVMVPRVSELLAKGDRSSLMSIADKTFNAVFALSIPAIYVCCCYASLIINLIAGEGYEGAVLPFKIVMILLLVIALEQIIIQQFLMAITKSKCIIVLSSLGALIGLLCNFLLDAPLKSTGAAISWAVSEIAILFVSLYFFKKYYSMQLPFAKMIKYCVAYAPILIVPFFFPDQKPTWELIIAFSLILLWFLFVNIKIVPNEFVQSLANRIKKK